MEEQKIKTTTFAPNGEALNNSRLTIKAGPRIKKRVAWVELPDEYEGFKARIWINAPTKYWEQLKSSDEEEALAGMQKIVIEHNGWLDFDGKPYPLADDPALWSEVPTELATIVLTAAQIKATEIPNSMASRNRRSKRG